MTTAETDTPLSLFLIPKMEARGKHLLDQCGSQTAALFEFEWDCMKSLAKSRGIAAEDNPFQRDRNLTATTSQQQSRNRSLATTAHQVNL